MKKILLFLLACAALPSAYATDWTYTVRQGDTLWGLCLKYTTVASCWQKIGDYNHVEYPRNLAPGTRIRFPVSWLKDQPLPVRVSYVKGVATQSPPDGDPVPIEAGNALVMGTQIKVGPEGVVVLRFADASIMTVEADSELDLNHLSNFGRTGMVDTRVHLRRGSVQTQVKKREQRYRFEVTTPSAVAAVRGTDFRVTSVGSDVSRSEVYSGAVLVANDVGESLLPKGRGLIVEKGKALPEPVPLPIAPILEDAEKKQAMPYEHRWQSVDGAASYSVEVRGVDSGAVIQTSVTEASNVVLTELAEGCYTIRVSAYSVQSLKGMPSDRAHCVYTPLSAPGGLNVQMLSDQSGISWETVPGAARYRVDVSSAKTFESVLLSQVVQTPFFDLPVKQEGDVYFRVIALDGNGNPGYSSEPYQYHNESYPKGNTGVLFTIFLMAVLIML